MTERIRQSLRMLLLAAAGDVALGLILLFLPIGGHGRMHVVSGILVIAAGLTMAGWVLYMRHRVAQADRAGSR